jgi:membrane-anchored mycosin MYCP
VNARPAGVVLTAAVAVAGLAVLTPAPAYADGDACESINAPDTLVDQRPDPSEPLADLRIEDVQDRIEQSGKAPGQGAVVAVLDSGISTTIGVRLRGDTPTRELKDWHGTAMAGVIAGPDDEQRPIGIAPAAELVDVPVYDTLQADEDGEVGLSSEGIAAGLQYVVDRQASLQTDIVVVPMPVSRTDAIDAAIKELDRRDVIVVAASGDRPTEDFEPLYGDYGDELGEDTDEPSSGEDAAKDAWPAGSESSNVVAVAAAAPDGSDSADIVLRNSAIDLAAPTFGLVGYGMNGAPCVVPHAGAQSLAPGSGFAAAEVAGVLALMETAYAGETAEQLLARLYATATGTTSVTANNVLTGHGIIQPLEALTRPLQPSKNGRLDTSQIRDRDNVAVDLPESEPDLLASTRENAAWWGLLGGGALLVAIVLRPVLARRRR